MDERAEPQMELLKSILFIVFLSPRWNRNYGLLVANCLGSYDKSIKGDILYLFLNEVRIGLSQIEPFLGWPRLRLRVLITLLVSQVKMTKTEPASNHIC